MKKVYLLPLTAIAISLLTACGNNTTKPEVNGPATETAPPVATTASAGAGMTLYNQTCAACHQANGNGIPNSFPPLAKSDFLADREKTIDVVVNGSSGEITVNGQKYNQTMPAQQLSNDDMAAVLTYVYTGLGNTGSAVSAAEVKAARGKK